MRNLKSLTARVLVGVASLLGSTLAPAWANSLHANLLATDRVVFVGDSITWMGVNDPNTLGWTIQFLEAADSTIPGVKVYDSGVPGDTTQKLLKRFSKTVLDLNPTVVVLWIGVNDAGTRTPIGTTQANFYQLINMCLQRPSIREIILVSPECIGELPDGQNPYDSGIDQIASYLYGIAKADYSNKIFYCPMRAYWAYEENLLGNKSKSKGVLTLDGIHPNVQGNAFLKNVFATTFGL